MAQGFAYDTEIINLAGNDVAHSYGSANCVPSTETLIATYTLTTDGVLKQVYGEGGTDGLFKLYINGSAIWTDRNAWTQRGVQTSVEYPLVIGDVVELKVTNQKSTNHIFTGGFYVYKL